MVLPVVPLIAAGAAVVARYIAKKGLSAAVKKYTKKAISEGKKHAKDMVTKPTAGQAGSNAGVRGMRNARTLGRQATLAGAVTMGVPAAVSITKLRIDLKKAKTEKMRIKIQKDIDNAVAAVEVARLKKKPTNEAPKTSVRPKTRPTSTNAPAKSLRPKARKP